MGRKQDLREVDAIAREFGLTGRLRFDFSDYLHELKVGGDLGSKPRGDFTTDELRERARWFKQERFGDDA